MRFAIFAAATGLITAGATIGYSSSQDAVSHRFAIDHTRSVIEMLQQMEAAHLEAKKAVDAALREASVTVNQTSTLVTEADGLVDAATLTALRSARDDLAILVRDHPAKTGTLSTATVPSRTVDSTLSTEEITQTALRLSQASETFAASTQKLNALKNDTLTKKTSVEAFVVAFANSVQTGAENVIAATENADEATKTSLAESLARLKEAIEKREPLPLVKFLDGYVAAAKAAQSSALATEARHLRGEGTPKGRGPRKKPDAKPEGPEPEDQLGAPPSPVGPAPSPAGPVTGIPAPVHREERRVPVEPSCKSQGGSGTGCPESPGTPSTPTPSAQSNGGWSISFLTDWIY